MSLSCVLEDTDMSLSVPVSILKLRPSEGQGVQPSPLYALQSLAHYGQVLGQFHHGNDDGSPDQSAGRPEQGVENSDVAVDLRQDGTVHSVRRVHETLDRVLRPETL